MTEILEKYFSIPVSIKHVAATRSFDNGKAYHRHSIKISLLSQKISTYLYVKKMMLKKKKT